MLMDLKNRAFELLFFLTIFSFTLPCSKLLSQTENLIVQHLSFKDGVPSRCIDCVYQDHQGFMWFGTRNGLLKYDGLEFTHYKHDKSDTSSLIYRWVKSIAEDHYGNLWLGTKRGMSQLIREENRIINYSAKYIDSLSNININKLHIDSSGNLWIGSYEQGLYFLSKDQIKKKSKSSSFEKIEIFSKISNLNEIECITENNSGIFVGTQNGLIKISKNRSEIEIYQIKNSYTKIDDNSINGFAFDKNDRLWIATKVNGLASFDLNKETFHINPSADITKNNIYTNWIMTIAIDKNGLIWCGMDGHSDQGGIATYNPVTKNINRYLSNTNLNTSIGPFKWWVNDLFFDNSSVLWLAYREGSIDRIIPEQNLVKFIDLNEAKRTDYYDPTIYDFQIVNETQSLLLTGMGIINFDVETNSFTQKFSKLNNRIITLSGERSLFLDTKGLVWVGTTSGFFKYDPLSEKTNFTSTESYNKPAIITEDSNNIYWIATFGDGLLKLDNKSSKITKYKNDANDKSTIGEDYINCIYNDNSSNFIWLGTDSAWLIRFNKKTGEAKNYGFGREASWISKIGKFEDNKIWIATGLMGFVIFNPKNETYVNYSTDKGLPHQETHEAYKDKTGNYWIVTNNGVSKLNPSTEILKNFQINDNNNFIRSFTGFNETNLILLKATKGFYYFYPDNMRENTVPPKMVLVDFKIYDKSLVNHKDSILTTHINLTNEIVLNHDMNDFTIEFAALHFSDPLKNEYKYILENFDNEWQSSGKTRTTRYTAIPHGDYNFKVLGSNIDGVWAKEPAELSIIILPPWWKTWWAYIAYSIFFAFVLYYLYELQKRRIIIRHEIEMKDFETLKLKEVDQMKSKFFANISHEFRTPLTLIKGPVERLLEKEKLTNTKNIYKVILKNSERLLNLINELLDLSKLESGKMKLSAQKADIVSFTKGIAMSFESFMQKKQIQINITTTKDIIELYFDKEKMQKIITNLLSNSFKFTSERGKIIVTLDEDIDEQKVIIIISDSGIGIPEKELSRIFNRFYQVSDSEHSDNIGTGIGLSLTKELVEMHHGNIEVKSKEGKGTTFTLKFLLGKNHLSDDEIIFEEQEFIEHSDEIEELEMESSNSENTTLLIVEDNKDVRDFIKSILDSKYMVIEAEDGEDGYTKAMEFVPDLIVSDIMMPKMTGDTMTEKLKKSHVTCHVPIILLTAKAAEEEKVNGLETGADDYLIKPFNEKELLARINNLIIQRRSLREKYLREAEINPTEVAVTSLDKKFIENVMDYVEENLSDPQFSVDNLVSKLAVSRAQLYRKFSSILGEKPNEFIRKYRIKRAAELIRKDFGNITEIAFEVGFNNLSYFSKCFKNVYKITPHEYSKNYLTNKNY
jgi:signal transduction histidine kinase/DNA-binding response OmpR family regulator/ligand-binding sensor domain-containing protein